MKPVAIDCFRGDSFRVRLRSPSEGFWFFCRLDSFEYPLSLGDNGTVSPRDSGMFADLLDGVCSVSRKRWVRISMSAL